MALLLISQRYKFFGHNYTVLTIKRTGQLLVGPFLPIKTQKLLLAGLVTLIELVNTAGGIDDLHLAGVEGVRSVGNLKLHKRVLDTVNNNRLLGGGAAAGDEYIFV